MFTTQQVGSKERDATRIAPVELRLVVNELGQVVSCGPCHCPEGHRAAPRPTWGHTQGMTRRYRAGETAVNAALRGRPAAQRALLLGLRVAMYEAPEGITREAAWDALGCCRNAFDRAWYGLRREGLVVPV